MSREAMKLALEALEDANDVARMEFSDENYYSEAINALRQALVDADDTSQKRVDKMVKTEHDRAVEVGKSYERGWNAALAQQDPVAWTSSLDFDDDDQEIIPAKDKGKLGTSNCDIPLYTAPKQWVGLTDDELLDFSYRSQKIDVSNSLWFDRWGFARAIEAKLKEKNA